MAPSQNASLTNVKSWHVEKGPFFTEPSINKVSLTKHGLWHWSCKFFFAYFNFQLLPDPNFMLQACSKRSEDAKVMIWARNCLLGCFRTIYLLGYKTTKVDALKKPPIKLTRQPDTDVCF